MHFVCSGYFVQQLAVPESNNAVIATVKNKNRRRHSGKLINGGKFVKRIDRVNGSNTKSADKGAIQYQCRHRFLKSKVSGDRRS